MTEKKDFDWLERTIEGLLNDFEGGVTEKEETIKQFFELIFDKLVSQIQSLSDHNQQIIKLIDEKIKKDDWNNKYQFYNNGWVRALTELKQSIEKL